MVAPAVTVTVAALTELAKLGLQIYFASGRQAGLTDEQLEELLNSERERFKKNVSQPLPDVSE
jgi:soluble P-type ATPase